MKLPRFLESIQGYGLGTSFKETKLVSHHEDYSVGETTGGLSVLFTILCIIDLFGVFPVVALPKSVIDCGILGIPLVVSVFALQLYTAMLLGKCWNIAQQIKPGIEYGNRSPYASVAELAFGPRAKKLVTILIDITIFGAGVPNLLVASQSLQLFWWKMTGDEVGVTYCVWLVVIGVLLCPVMWLGSPKDMKPLALTSVCIVTSVAISIWCFISLDDVSPIVEFEEYTPKMQDFLIAYGVIAFQFDIHPMLLTIQVDMKDSSKINIALLTGFGITTIMFAVTSILAFLRYGHNVQANILQGIPASIPLYIVALLVTLQLCLSSAVGHSALFQHIEDMCKISRDFCIQRCMIRSSIVALAVFLGEAVPRFDLVMGLIGSTLTGPLMFIFPPLFFLKLCFIQISQYKKNNIIQDGDYKMARKIKVGARTKTYNTFNDFEDVYLGKDVEFKVKWSELILAAFVMVLGCLATILATYSSWSDAIASAKFTQPCLVNATAAARSMFSMI